MSNETQVRWHLTESKRLEQAATSAREYRQALHHAREAVRLAKPGSLLHTWALHAVSVMSANLGDFRTAKASGESFFTALPEHPEAEVLVPWVAFALGRAEHYSKRYANALRWFGVAQEQANPDLAERIRLFRVWTLAESGHVRAAAEALPADVTHVPVGHLNAARAVVNAMSGNWQSAHECAVAALRDYRDGAWPVFDMMQVAELLLILKRAARYTGQHGVAAAWRVFTAPRFIGWEQEAEALLLPNLPREWGCEWFEEAPARCGSRGDARRGTLGSVG